MGIPTFHVNAFTHKPFGGNPASVCLLNRAGNNHWMQNIAREINLPVTVFSHPIEDAYSLRWFTPTTELDSCGHGTLAAAHILWEEGRLANKSKVRLVTCLGVLTAVKNPHGIELDFPAYTLERIATPNLLAKALGTKIGTVYTTQQHWVIELPSEEILRNLKPDFSMLIKMPVTGIMVTTRSQNSSYDFVSRYFAPNIGINEDSATGTAHRALGPYWKKRTGKNEFTAYQASARGGTMKVRLSGDRVFLTGQAVTLLRGELLVH